MSCGRRPAPRNVVKWDVGRPAPRPPRTFAVMRSPADCVVGGGVPDAPRRGQRLAAHNERRQFATQTRSCGCLPHRGKHCSHPGFAPLNRGPCSQPRNPSLRCKGYGVVMARLRAGHARPLQGGVNELRAKARPTECGKVGCRAACPQAAADVCGNEKPCGLCCRGRRPRRPAEGSTLGGAQRAPPVCYANPLVRLFAPQGQTLLTPRFRSAQPWSLFATPQPLPTMQRIRGGNGKAAGRACPAPTGWRE